MLLGVRTYFYLEKEHIFKRYIRSVIGYPSGIIG